jgi:cytochrome c553
MKTIASLIILALTPALALAAEKPEWAFPVTEKDLPKPRIEGTKMRSVGAVTISRAAADDFFNVPDWRPDLHPPMPKVVQYGNKETQLRACGSCHLPTGNGHDESAYVAGLPVSYTIRQMADWKKRRPQVRWHHGAIGQACERRRDTCGG